MMLLKSSIFKNNVRNPADSILSDRRVQFCSAPGCITLHRQNIFLIKGHRLIMFKFKCLIQLNSSGKDGGFPKSETKDDEDKQKVGGPNGNVGQGNGMLALIDIWLALRRLAVVMVVVGGGGGAGQRGGRRGGEGGAKEAEKEGRGGVQYVPGHTCSLSNPVTLIFSQTRVCVYA